MKCRPIIAKREPIHIPRQKVVQANKPNANKRASDKYCRVNAALKKAC
jgi:hypothetical protein